MGHKQIQPSSEFSELQRQQGSVVINLPVEDHHLQLRYRFLRQGYDIRQQEEQYAHPAPPFCRLFIFFNTGAQIIIKGKCTQLTPEKIWLIPPGNPFDITYYQSSELLFYHICVTDFTGSQVFSPENGLLELNNSELVSLFLIARYNNSNLLLRNIASTALGFMIEPYLTSLQKKTHLATRFRIIFEALENEPPASLRVEELAERMAITPSALSKSFRRNMQISLKQFLEQRTLEKAQELLLFTNMTAEAVSNTLGFNDPHYFYRYFRQKTGLTPTRYRHTSE